MSRDRLPMTTLQSKAKSVQRNTETDDEQSLQMKRLDRLAVTPHNAIQLQRTLGNTAVQRLITQQNQGSQMSIQRQEASKEEMERVEKALANLDWDKDVLQVPEGLMAVMPFAEKEFSTENVECQLMILRYKAASPNDRIDLLWEIQQTFLEESSPKNVNVSKSLVQDIQQKSDRKGPTDDLLKDLEAAIGINLADTYSRLIFDTSEASEPFRDYVIRKAQQKRAEKRVQGRKKAMGKITSVLTKIGSDLWNDGGVWGPRSKKK